MYWLYFILLIVAISTPIFIESEAWHVSEDVRESALILVVGTIGFLLYVLKEKSLIRHMREKLWFQQKNSIITKDLSQSYSYIGEVNRKVDILKDMMHRLVGVTESHPKKVEKVLWEILDTIKHVTQAERVSLRIFTGKTCTRRLEENGDKKIFAVVTDRSLLESDKKFFEVENVQCVFSHGHTPKAKMFLLLSRKHNEEIDADILSILTDFLVILQKYIPKGDTVV